MKPEVRTHANTDRAKALSPIGKPVEVISAPDGSRVQILPYGGRVLGLFAPDDDENFFWTNPVLGSSATARAFYGSSEWHNSGGDRAWIAPEAEFFYPNWPKADVYIQPRKLDPGRYTLERSRSEVRLTNRMCLQRYSEHRNVDLSVTRTVTVADNPLRDHDAVLAGSLAYAGYTLKSMIKVHGRPGRAGIGLWNLLQVPHGGQMLIPTYYKAQPVIYFGDPSRGDFRVGNRMVRWIMRGSGNHKIGLDATVCAGRAGYLYRSGARWSLIVRSMVVNPSADYVDYPFSDEGKRGCAVQACAVNDAVFGRFCELEYHTPSVGCNGENSLTDVSQVWAFRGKANVIRRAVAMLLGGK